MTNTKTLAKQSFEAGYKWSESEFRKHGGSFGDYYYRVFTREFNKLAKAKAEAETAEMKGRNSKLIDRLFAETETLRVEYLEKIAIWSEKEFGRLEDLSTTIARYEDFDGRWKEYCSLSRKIDAARLIRAKGFEAFKARELVNAETFYSDSILKLAARIEKKGMNGDAITIKTGRVGVNIETVLTDGIQTVRAWTIVASGPIQKPHYRYLVK